MLAFLKRMFSWQGYVGRVEFALTFFFIQGVISLIFLGFLLSSLLRIPGSVTSIFAAITALLCCYFSILLFIKRFRHVGISAFWVALFPLFFLIPGLKFFLLLVVLVFCFVPGKGNSPAPQLTSGTIVSVLATSVLLICLPIFMTFSMVFLAKKSPKTLKNLPAFSTKQTDRISSQGV